VALHLIRCAVCSETFEAVRSDAETCSGRCRERRRKARQAAEIRRAAALLASLAAAARLTPDD
jgi:predicted nucleic acid-binding Zn ribbon protein